MAIKNIFLSFFFILSAVQLSHSQDAEIKQLRSDVEELAHKKYKGREAGTKQEKDAAEFIAKRFKEIGLMPLGNKAHIFKILPFQKQKIRIQVLRVMSD